MTEPARVSAGMPSTRRHWPLAALLASLTMIGPFAIDEGLVAARVSGSAFRPATLQRS